MAYHTINQPSYDQINKAMSVYRARPSTLNILNYAHLNENAHTAFLCALLKHRIGRIPVFLKSFLLRLDNAAFTDISSDTLSAAKVKCQANYIDLLIECGTHSIIMENKICGASDQHKQIVTYVETLKNSGKPAESIWVIYLTLVGGEPEKHSLPDDLAKELGDRYVSLAYSEILNWIEETVLPECPYKEEHLIRSLELYGARIKTMLGTNILQETTHKLMDALDCHYDRDSYSRMHLLLNEFPDTVKDETKAAIHEETRSMIQSVLREIERKNPYFNEDALAYALKWMFRDDPPAQYRTGWQKCRKSVQPYVSGVFMYCGGRYLQLSANGVRIHLRCSPDGIKTGPYIFTDGSLGYVVETEKRFGRDYLSQNGLVLTGDSYKCPFTTFSESTTPLMDVFLHIKKLVEVLNNSPSPSSNRV